MRGIMCSVSQAGRGVDEEEEEEEEEEEGGIKRVFVLRVSDVG